MKKVFQKSIDKMQQPTTWFVISVYFGFIEDVNQICKKKTSIKCIWG